jgi:hypothetical protein
MNLDNDIEVFLHVTPLDNLYSILSKGLEPKIGTRSQKIEEKTPAIYLFNSLDDCNNALMNWLGEEFDEDYGEGSKVAILKISLPVSKLFNKEDHESYETIQYDHIPAKYIKLYSVC